MKLTTIFAYSMLLVAGAAAAVCNHDNCYRQLLAHAVVASPFCAEYITSINTEILSLPSYVSASCGTARVSSACSCLLTATTGTPTTSSTVSVKTTSFSFCPTPLTCDDGCYSQLATQSSAGSSFCASFTSAVTTATGAIPPSLHACGLSAASNACSCLHPLTKTPPPFTTTKKDVVMVTVTTTVVACPSSVNLLESAENPCTSPPWVEGGYQEIEGSVGYQDVQVAYPPGSPPAGSCAVIFNSTSFNFGAFEFDQFLDQLPTPGNYTLTWWSMSPTLAETPCYMYGAIGLGRQGGYHSGGSGILTDKWTQFVYKSQLFPVEGDNGGYVAIDVLCSRGQGQTNFSGVVYVDQVQLFASRDG